MEARWLESEGRRLVFVFNRERETKRVRLRWREGGRWRTEDLLTGGAAQPEFELAGRDVRVLAFEEEQGGAK